MPVRLPQLDDDPHTPFPTVESALREPDGLLALGGDLSPPRLLNAYRHGIFPWYSSGQPILWWSPDPRMVFRTTDLRLPSRLRRTLRRSSWVAQADTGFTHVIDACAHTPRPGQAGTWITDDMRAAYCELHRLGHAHSVEVYDTPGADAKLVGGIYGVAVGRMFFGESMFSAVSGGSKVALAALAYRLAAWCWPLIDAQVESEHLARLGGLPVPRADFVRKVAVLAAHATPPGAWTAAFGELAVCELGG